MHAQEGMNDGEEGPSGAMANRDEIKSQGEDLSPHMKYWSKDQVRNWVLSLDGVDERTAEILFKADINGPAFVLLDKKDLREMDVTYGPAKIIIHARDEDMKLQKEEPTISADKPQRLCKPYPFSRNHDTYRYIESSILDITESGASDLIEPCHEYKAFTNTTDETKMIKFTAEVIRFSAACMNSRTNGTIHFGIGDKPEFTHGQVLGVVVEDKEVYTTALKSAIHGHFEHKHKGTAQMCIKPPRFVGVLNKNMTSSNKCVIEVDIVPHSTSCADSIFHTSSTDLRAKKKAKSKEADKTETKQLFVRDGGSSKNLLVQTSSGKSSPEFQKFVANVAQLSKLRKEAEEKHLQVIKNSNQGSKLSQMITGGTRSLDRSNFECYVIVTNKSDSAQFESLAFLVELNPTAVLDFDPESSKNGLQNYFEQQSSVVPHLPEQYKITEGVEDIAKKLKLTRSTSWVLCNGGTKDAAPSDMDQWLMDKGASVRDVISFLCRKNVLPNRKYLVIFLLLSTVSEKMDPLVEIFSTFCQELRGQTEQILCLCNNENAFTSWKNLIDARCGVDISGRCIYELSFAEVNGTVLNLWSKNRRSIRFLPCGGQSRVLLEKKLERSLNTIEILCVNQCEGGNEDQIAIEKNFYKGGKVSWWNFYFTEQPGSTPFIKRDKFDLITNTVMPDLCALRKACVLLNLLHVPGCGGTTLAMHTLWAFRDRYRCAVLKCNNADFAEVANQVVQLLLHDHKERSPPLPVLLMIDDFDDMEKVFDLQQFIEKECMKKEIQSRSAQVIILNCMRSESSDKPEETQNTLFIGNDLSEGEQEQFEQKLVEIDKTHKNADTFYGFMIMKKNFSPEYIQRVVRNTLKTFNIDQKPAQLVAVLVLLNVYCKGASLSVTLCEDFLGSQQKPICGAIKIEDGFEKFSPFIAICSVESNVVFKAVKIIHSSIAKQCLKELKDTHNVSKADITDLLLNTDLLYGSTQGKQQLLHDVRHILVRRQHSLEESKFSPLIQDISGETPGLEEHVLLNASKRFEKDAVICQLLARHYYLKKEDFAEAKRWASKARKFSKDSSYIADTSAQVIKHELKNAIAKQREQPISPERLSDFLKMAQSATDMFKEAQTLAKKESVQRLQTKTDNNPFDTSGSVGVIQVGVLVIQVLQKIPIFSLDNVCHDKLTEILTGRLEFKEVQQHDPKVDKNRQYYPILRQFEDFLCNLRHRMKTNFDFLDNFYVNLGTRFGLKDRRELVSQMELDRCFKVYVNFFCKIDSAPLWKSKTMMDTLKFTNAKANVKLEMEKADTYSGILDYLTNQTDPDQMERIAGHYKDVCATQHSTLKDKINSIYVSVVLSCLKQKSAHIMPYEALIGLLFQTLRKQIPLNERLPLNFIAVALLWPSWKDHRPEFLPLMNFISQMKTCYHAEMREVYNGKRPIIHFFLGNKRGYRKLIHIGEIKRCIAGQEEFSSLWENGKIWKHKDVEQLLWRGTGEVKGKVILADTCRSDLKPEITPMFQTELSGLPQGSRVSFFIGFSMKGPLAIAIHMQSQ